MEFLQGVVDTYNPDRGFGFIRILREGKRVSVFFHISQWFDIGPPAKEIKVQFVLATTTKGPQAHAITVQPSVSEAQS
jgi:cold shock CspA family protein